MLGLAGLIGVGGLAGSYGGAKAQQGLSSLMNRGGQAAAGAAGLKKASLEPVYNMQEFFEKTATLADRPTLNNFANYLDCTVKLNPALGVLKQASVQLRQHKSVMAAFHSAYPKLNKTSRAKVAARLVSTYLTTHQQVADAVQTLEHPND